MSANTQFQGGRAYSGNPKRVAIVGAGISGLSAAWALKKAGFEPLIFDTRPRAGGVLETTHIDGCLVEGGPDSYLAQKPHATALIRELGMDGQLIGSNDDKRKTFIVRKGQLVPMPDGLLMMVPTKVMPMIGTRLLSWPTKIRMGFELFRSARAKPREADISVADFFRDHYTQEAVDYLAEPLLAGVYGGDPERMSAPSVIGRFVELEHKYGSLARGILAEKRKRMSKGPSGQPPAPLFRSLRNGMGSLSTRLVDAIGPEHFHLGQRVEALEAAVGGFRLRIAGNEIHVPQVVIAAPAHAVSSLLESIEPAAAGLLEEIPYNSSATVALIYDISQFSQAPVGFGFLVPRRERQTMVAATYVQNKFPYRAPADKVVIRCFVGKAAEENTGLRDDAALIAAVRKDLQRLTGLAAEPKSQAVFRWHRAMAQYEVGHARKVAAIRERMAFHKGLYLAGNAFEGIGIPDCVNSGQQAAAACERNLTP